MSKKPPLVGIIMGSQSDLTIMKDAARFLDDMKVPFELTIVSAHRTPERMTQYAATARARGLRVIIAGAGGATHLPGMIAASTTLPVIGVPVKSANSLEGWDSILSILQMPSGVPVATVALNGAKNAGILALQVLATYDKRYVRKLEDFKTQMKKQVLAGANKVAETGWQGS